jgi:hypothetical protein
MKSLTVRVLLVALAIAAQAGAGYLAWQLDQKIRADRSAVTTFEAQARQASQALAAIGATQRGYVAEGQSSERWQTQVTTMMSAAVPKLTDLRAAARTPEAQGALESAIETMASFGQADAKARDYANSGQRLSASDVIFADGYELLNKAMAAIDTARDRENAQHESAVATRVQTQLMYLGGAVGLTIVILLLLVPVARKTDAGDREDQALAGSGLGLSQGSGRIADDAENDEAAVASAFAGQGRADAEWLDRVRELGDAANICTSLARVRDSKDLPPLLEQVARTLDATGVIVWMTEGSPVVLRPVLAHGYPPGVLARMGSIGPDADNATATAFRTRSAQMVKADPTSGGALVVPLVTADGCTGAMAVELKKGVDPGDYLRAVATILAAQLATLITPAAAGDASRGKE